MGEILFLCFVGTILSFAAGWAFCRASYRRMLQSSIEPDLEEMMKRLNELSGMMESEKNVTEDQIFSIHNIIGQWEGYERAAKKVLGALS